MIGIIISAGIMAGISAYMLFKIKDSDFGVNLQPLFFFMILASFIIMGSAGYESRNDCEYLLSNSTITGNTTLNAYSYTCTERAGSAGSWAYRLPLWFGYLSSLYLFVYFFMMIKDLVKNLKGGGGRG